MADSIDVDKLMEEAATVQSAFEKAQRQLHKAKTQYHEIHELHTAFFAVNGDLIKAIAKRQGAES